MKTTVLIPAHNEVEAISDTIKSLIKTGLVEKVVVVDDGSTDQTVKIASQEGADTIRLEKNIGKGGALNRGIEKLAGDFDILVLIDADVRETAVEAAKLISPILEGRADMTIGILPGQPGTGGFGLVKRLALNGLIRMTGRRFKAPLSGQRALKRDVVDAVTPFEHGYGMEVAMTIDAIRKRFTVMEVQVDMHHSYTGKTISGFLHRGKQYIDIRRSLRRRD